MPPAPAADSSLIAAIPASGISNDPAVLANGLEAANALAVSPNGRFAYLLKLDNHLLRLDLTKGTIGPALAFGGIAGIGQPVVAVTPYGRTAIVDYDSHGVLAVDVRRWAIARRIEMPAGSGDVVVSLDDRHVFVLGGTTASGGAVSKVDLATGSVNEVARIPGTIEAIAYTAAGVAVENSQPRIFDLDPATLR
jgi:DNA-binding beta-propeller fold protein YncE